MATQIIVILQEPQMGENIGATARAMGNFGYSDLRLVNPKKAKDHPKAIAMAVKTGKSVLESSRKFTSIADAVADCHFTFATTCDLREQIKNIYSPASAYQHSQKSKMNDNQDIRIGLIFGPERTGLSNSDIARCQGIITIPTTGSLNLAQAVLLVLHHIKITQNEMPAPRLVTGDTEIATQKEVHNFYSFLEDKLDRANFWREPRKKNIMWQNMRNIFHRCNLTSQEVRTLMGMVRTLFEKRSGEK